MPLVTRNTGAGNVYAQSAEPDDKTDGTMWVDTDTGAVYTADGSTYIQQTVGVLGSATQTVSVNSAATALEYASAGAWSRLGVATLAGGTLSITGLTAYEQYMVIFHCLTDTNSVSILARLNNDSAGNYGSQKFNNGTFASSFSATSINIGAFAPARIPAYMGVIYLGNKFGTRNLHSIIWHTGVIDVDAAGGLTHDTGSAVHAENADISRFDIIPSGGTLITGSEFVIFGRNIS